MRARTICDYTNAVACILLSMTTMENGGFAFVPSASRSLVRTTETSLQSKNSDRAHIERTLEDMMDNDWRVFRAKLVLQEKAAATGTSSSSSTKPAASPASSNASVTNSNSSPTEYKDDEKLAKQGHFSDLFAGAISSIFKSGGGTSNQNGKDGAAATSTSSRRKRSAGTDGNIFKGHSIGGAIPIKEILCANEDPFVSEAELPSFLKPKAVLDKRRWAHEIPHVEKGCVLIANEKLGGVFHQTVVLITQHCEKSGSLGMVINRPMGDNLLKVASKHETKLDLSLKLAFPSAKVSYGGPVMTDEFSILHGYGEVEGSTKLCSGVYVGGSQELMDAVRMNRFDPRDALFCKGHAAWVAGQLNREISKGVWYTAAVSSDFLLRYAGASITEEDDTETDLWSDILTCMDGKFADIARNYGGRGDRRMP